jgi:hypothetical protein
MQSFFLHWVALFFLFKKPDLFQNNEPMKDDLHMLSREVEVLGRKHRRPSGRHSQLRLDAWLPEDEQYNVWLNFADKSLGQEYKRSRKRAVMKVRSPCYVLS